MLDDCFSAEQIGDVANRRGQIDPGHLELAFSQQIAQPLDDVARSTVVVDDVREDRVDL